MDKIFKLKGLMGKLFKHAPVDAAVDQLGKRLMYDALPPALEVALKSPFFSSSDLCFENNASLDTQIFYDELYFPKLYFGEKYFFWGKKILNILVRGEMLFNVLVGEIFSNILAMGKMFFNVLGEKFFQ